MTRSPPAVIELDRRVARSTRPATLEVAALRDVSMRIEENEFVAIVGPVGLGQVDAHAHPRMSRRPDVGRRSGSPATTCSSLDENRLADVRNRFIGFVFQQFNLLAYLPAWRNVELPLVYAGVAPRRAARAGAGRARPGRAGRPRRPPARRALGRPAAAGRDRPGARHRAGDDPRRRAHRQPRLDLDRRHPRPARATLHREGRTIVLITHEPDVAAAGRADGRDPRRPDLEPATIVPTA